MQIIQLSDTQFAQLKQLLENLLEELEKRSNDPLENQYIENGEFIRIMRISRRTARDWRDQGKLPFTQLGKKIYYPMKEINALLQRNYRPASDPFMAIKKK